MSETCSPWVLTGTKSARPLTIVRSTSIGHAVLGTFCIAVTSGSGSERREAEFAFECIELAACREVSEEQQMGNFFERRVGRKIVDVVAAIGQTADLALDIAQDRRTNDDAFETAIDNRTSRQRNPPEDARRALARGLVDFEGAGNPACRRKSL